MNFNCIDEIKNIIICGVGFQTETIVSYLNKRNVNEVIILVDHFTQKPTDCYKIPSKRNFERNSFSEVDMMMDPFIRDVPVKRFDMLSAEEKTWVFAYYSDEESKSVFDSIRPFISENIYFITPNEIKSINNYVWDNDDIIRELWETNKYLYSEMQLLKNVMRRQLQSTVYDFHFEFHLVEHCNLKCTGCTHFSSIAEEEFADIDEFRKDINRLSELTNGITRFINLLGGEPLLHPQIYDFLDIARKAFPNATIRVVTNGIRLLDMKPLFWEKCRINNVIIGLTKYPIEIDYDKRINKIQAEEVGYECFSGDYQQRDEMWRLCLDETGSSRPLENFIRCPRANACIFVKHGKVFNCATMANIEHFNKCFGTNLKICEADFADIYKCQTIDELFSKLCNPKPFCRFCYLDGREYGVPWNKTNISRCEWTASPKT